VDDAVIGRDAVSISTARSSQAVSTASCKVSRRPSSRPSTQPLASPSSRSNWRMISPT